MKSADASKILSQVNYLATHRGADAIVLCYVSDVRRKIADGDMPMARQFLKNAIAAWEESTGYKTRRGEVARWAAAA